MIDKRHSNAQKTTFGLYLQETEIQSA
jgi:hypothetical protein